MSDYQVVVSFRCQPRLLNRDELQCFWEAAIQAAMHDISGLDVAIRQIGAGGDTMEHEGLYPEGSLRTDDIDVVMAIRDTDEVKAKDGML